ncbi:IS1182 family transposase [Deinococcus cellulosilyticus]|nr:IS1182 family transposase [Deinococcus cellulosilyticus]
MIPKTTRHVAQAVFPQPAPAMRFRDEFEGFLQQLDFAALYPVRGKPALPPWRLLLVTILQFSENLTDREAAHAVKARLDWKYALSLDLKDPGFHYSVLSEFRDRLLKQENLLAYLDVFLQCCKDKGLLKTRGKQRTDSTHVLAQLRVMNRYELVAETLRAVLNTLATHYPEWIRDYIPKHWYEKYAHRFENYRLPKKEWDRADFLRRVGMDGYYMLCALEQDSAKEILQKQFSEVEAFQHIWKRHFRRTSRGVELIPSDELPPARLGVESPYESEAKYSTKRGKEWVGYKVHYTETCDEDLPHLIVHIDTTTAEANDAPRLELIHQALQKRALLPAQHWVDAGYVSAEQLCQSQNQYGIGLIGPPRGTRKWQKGPDDRFDLRDFRVLWDEEKVICPSGSTSISWKAQTSKQRGPSILAKFRGQECLGCALRKKCTTSTRGKQLVFLPRDRQEALFEARDLLNSEEGKKLYQLRAGVESVFSQGVRAFGLRKSRYRGLAKTHQQNIFVALAMNYSRLEDWFAGNRPQPTRISALTRAQPIRVKQARRKTNLAPEAHL